MNRLLRRALATALVVCLSLVGVPIPEPVLRRLPPEIRDAVSDFRNTVEQLLGPGSAMALQIKRVQKGTKVMDSNDVNTTASLTYPVDLTKSIVLLTIRDALITTSTARDQNQFITAQFEDSSTLSFDKGGASQATTLQWTVIEFVDGVKVQRGISSMTETIKLKYVQLPETLDRTKSIPIITLRSLITTRVDTEVLVTLGSFYDKGVDANSTSDDVTSNNHLRIERLRSASEAGQNRTANICWQVLEFLDDDAVVKSGTTDIAYNALSATADISGTPITDTTKAMLFLNYSGGNQLNGVDETMVPRGTITNANTLTFNRMEHGTQTGDYTRINWYLLELADSSSLVQRGAGFAMASGAAAPQTGTIGNAQGFTSAIDVDRSFPLIYPTAGVDNTTYSNDLFDDINTTAELTGTQTLTLTRGVSGTTGFAASVNWSVTEFQPLTVMVPNGDEVWEVGQAKNIVWKHSDSLLTGGTGPSNHHLGKIEVSVNGGSSYIATAIVSGRDLTTDVSGSVDNEGSYEWTIPATLNSTELDVKTCRIKVTDTDLTVRNFDVSNANFEIRGKLTVTAPNTGVTWKVDETVNDITWTTNANLDNNGNGKIRLELWHTNGTVYDSDITTSVTDVTASTGTYDWTIPNKIRADLRVKAKLMQDGTTAYASLDATEINDFSDASFTVAPQLELTAHNGGTPDWPTQTVQNVTWTFTGTWGADNPVTLWYSTNNGGNWTSFQNPTAAVSPGSYAWTVPIAAISDQAMLKVSAAPAAGVTVEEISDANFKIVPSLEITSLSPDGTGSTPWKVGQQATINWEVNGAIANVKLEYSTNGFADELETYEIVASTEADNGTPGDGLGSYTWPSVDDRIDADVRIRVSKVGDATINDLNGASAGGTGFDEIKIRGTVTVVAPNGSETDANALRVHTAQIPSSFDISWNRAGSFGNVDLHYKTSGAFGDGVGVGDGAIVSNLNIAGPTPHEYAWQVPDAVTQTARVRVRSTTYNADTWDESDANFHIKGQIDVTNPDGAEILDSGVQDTITWNSAGGFSTVKVEYTADGTNWNELAASTDNDGSFDWTPTIVDNRYLVRVTQTNDQYVVDTSAAQFEVKGSIISVGPDGNADPALTEYWRVGQSKNITWNVNPDTGGGVGNANVLYSLDGGTNFPNPSQLIGTTASTDESFLWTIPAAAQGESVRLRVHKDGDLSTGDDSNNNIRIYDLTLTYPGATELRVGDNYMFNWTKGGAFSTPSNEFRIMISKEGAAYEEITNPASRPTGSAWQWTGIPASYRSNDIKFKIEWMGDTGDFSVPVNPASITIKPKVDLTAPDGNQTINAGTAENITFIHTGALGDTWRLRYSTDGGEAGSGTYPAGNIIGTVTNVAPNVSYDYEWNIPALTSIISNTVRVKVELVGDEANVKDESANNIAVKGSITGVQPAGNADPVLTEYWRVGQTKSITWNSSPDDQGNVVVVYSKDAGANFVEPDDVIGTLNSALETRSWLIPAGAAGEQVRFRVYREADSSVKGTTAQNIKVYNLTITTPGATELRVGNNYTFNWTKTGNFSAPPNGPSNEFKLYADVGGGYQEITSGSLPTGTSWQWTNIPASFRGNSVKVKLEWQGDPADFSVETNPFTIKPKVDLTAPDGNTTEGAGTEIPITFTHTGDTSDSWRLLYSVNGGDAGGGTYPNPANVIDTVTNVTPNQAYNYNWTLPSVPSILVNTVRVKVELVGDEANVKDESANNFTVKGSITNAQPAGNADVNLTEYWRVGQTKNISWTSSPADQGDVTIVYSLDGSTFPEPANRIVNNINSSTSPYPWAIPGAAVSESVKFKVYRNLDTSVVATTPNNIKVYDLSLTYPGATELRVGNNYTFNWTKSGAYTTPSNAFRIMASKDGAAYEEITNPASRPTGSSWQWTGIPTSWRSNDVKFKLEWMGDTTDFSIPGTPAAVTIKPKVDLTAPDGNTTEGAGTQIPITFTHTGDNVTDTWRLRYSTDGGDAGSGTYPAGNIITTVSGASPVTHNWTIPSLASVISNTVRVKVELVGDEANVKDESANNFAIKGTLTNVQPNGNSDANLTEYWRVGQTKAITWSSAPSDQGDVKVVYSKDSGVNFVEPDDLIGTLNSSLGTQSWLIPSAAAGEQVRFRVYRALDSSVKGDTQNNIKVYHLQLTSPGATELRVGDNYMFNWSKVGAFSTPSNEFRISVNKDGAGYSEITNPASRPTGSTWQWANIPAAMRSDDIRVKLEWMGDTTDFVLETGQISIKPRVNLTAPDGNTTEAVNTEIPITFTHTGTTGDSWKIRYSTDGGDAGGGTYPAGNVIDTVTSVDPGTPYTYDWTIPTLTSILSNTVRVKVELVGDEANVKDESANTFAIKGTIANPQPNGNADPALTEYWRVGQTKSITWSSTPSDQGNVTVVYSKDAGVNFVEPDDVIGTLNSSLGTRSWLIPSGAVSESVRFRIYRVADSSVKGDTQNNVRVYHLQLTSPGATELRVGNDYTFNWAKVGAFSTPSNEFRVSISKDGAAYEELTNPAARPTGSSWIWSNIPTSYRSDDIKFKLEWLGDTTDFSLETGQLTIKPKVDLTAPDGNTTESAGTQIPITFSHTGTASDTWRLLYSTNGGDAGGGTYPNPANVITTVQGASPVTHNWTIPTVASILSSTVRVKVELVGDEANVKDESANTFTVKGSLTGLQPAGNADVNLTEYWRVGQTKNITWTSNPTDQGDVTLVYSLDGSSFPEPANQIVNNINSGTSPYPWTVPGAAVSETVKFKIYRNLDTSVTTSTPNNIKVYDLTLTYPGAQDLKVGGNYTFNWSKSGAFSTPSNEFRIMASKEGAGYVELTDPGTRPTGSSWAWNNIPTSWRSNDVKFKLEWMGDTTDFSIPAAPASVTIKPTVNLTAPDGNTTELSGTTIPVTFTHTGATTDSWKLLYSTNGGDAGGGTYPDPANVITTLTDIAPNSPYTHNWTIPSVSSILSNTVRVKVQLVGDEANVKDESLNNFAIKGAILNFAPQGNSDVNLTEYWRVGQNKSITWNSHPADQGLVTVVFSTDGGTNFPEPGNVIGTPNSSAGSQSWSIPAEAVSEQVRLRTYRQADSGIKGESANNLKVYDLQFTYPAATELKVGNNYTFSWTKSGLFATPSNEFRIMASKDGGAYQEITNPAARPTGTSWQWTNIPTSWRSNDVKFQLEWMGDTTDFQIPAAPASVTIKPKVDLTAPDGNTTEGSGTQIPITFTHTGTTGDSWKIRYSTDGGDAGSGTYPAGNVIDTVTDVASPYTYNWTIPSVSSVLSNQVRVKVELVGDESGVKDESANNFTIKGTLLSFTPQGNSDVNLTEYWRVGQTKSITWDSHPADQGAVTVVYSTDGGSTFTEPDNVIGAPNSSANSQSWLIPAAAVSEQVRVRTYRQADSSIKGESANNLKVYQLQLNYPAAQDLKVGGNYTFNWSKVGLFATPSNEFRIMASKDGGAYQEITNPAARPTGSSWQWTNIPISWRSDDVKFQLEWMGDTTDFQIPAAPASVTIKPTVNLTAPDGNTTEGAGTQIPITFTHTGALGDFWKILYSTDGTTYPDPANVIDTVTNVAPGTPYTYNWTIPSVGSVLTGTARVKVQLVGDEANVKDESANTFAIKGSLLNFAPQGNSDVNLTEYWRVGQTKSVTWVSHPADQGNVTVVFSTDGGTTFPEPANVIAAPNSSANSQSWVIPAGAVSEQVRLRTYRQADSSIKGESANNLKVYDLQFTYPAAQDLKVGGNYTFNWTKTGAFSTPSNEFRIMGSKDGAAYAEITNPAARPTGSSWAWNNIPTSWRSNDVKFKLEWMGDTTDFSIPAAPASVTIKPTVDLTAPDGNTTEGAGTTIDVTFTHAGTTADSWKLLYSTNGGDAGGGTYPDPANVIATLTDIAPGTPYTHDWTIPNLGSVLTNTARVKVQLVGDEANVKDESLNNFAIKGAILNFVPQGNADANLTEYWRVGQTKSITWTSSPADQGNVTVVYSTDGGTTFPEPGNVIGTPNSSAGSQSWSIPAEAVSEQVRLRTYRQLDSSIKGESANNLKVYDLTFTYPGAQDLKVGGNYTFNWTKTGAFSTPSNEFRIMGSKDGGVYQEITNPAARPTGASWAWNNIPTSWRSNDVKFKLEWVGDTTDFSIPGTPASVTIKPTVNLTAPDGNTTEGAGTTIDVTFTHTGTTADSWKILYSTNGGDAGGGTYPDPTNVIDTVTGVEPGTPYTYDWTIPSVTSVLSNTVRVKVQLVGDEANVKDESLNNFAIKGSILNVQPNGNADANLTEYWRVGQTKSVTWGSSPADQGDVKVVYSKDAGSNFVEPDDLIGTLNSSIGTQSWLIPSAAIGEQTRFRVYRVADSSVKGDTLNNVKIYSLQLGSPGATELRVGNNYTFNWSKVGAFTTPSNEFKVSVSKDGAAYQEITNPAARPTGSSWQWTNIPASFRSNDIRVKLEWMGDTTDFSLETGQITIKPKVDLTAPDGNTTEGAGTTVPITFSHTGGTGDTWRLRYSTDGGDVGSGTYPAGNIITTLSDIGSPYTHNWSVPTVSSIISSAVRVKVELVGDETNVKDESANNFTIKGSILNVQPNGNADPVNTEYWRVGQTKSVTWSSSPSDQGDVKVVYSKDAGSNFVEPDDLIAQLNSAIGTQSWLIPATAVTEQARFRVYRVLDSSVKGETLNNVKIYHLQLNTPGTTELRIGNNYTFNWAKTGLFAAPPNGPSNEFKLYADIGTGYQEITGATLPTGTSWQWANIPASFRGDSVKVKLEWQGDPGDFSVETGLFTIKPKVDLTAPDGNTTEGAATTIPITFTHTGATSDFWRLRYSTDGGDAGSGTYPAGNIIVEDLTSVAPNTPYTYNWTIPSVGSVISSQVRVKVELQGDETNVKDESANNFTVKGSILNVQPNGNADANLTEYWRVGQTKNVSWTSSPADQGDVRLAYSLDGGSSFPAGQEFATINSSLSPYPWLVPAGAQGESVRFRVYRVADSAVKGDTSNNIKIYDLNLTYPAATELRVGDSYTFNWSKGGAFNTPSNEFRIMASKEGAQYAELTNPASRPTGTSWQWSNIPASWRTNDVKFKVEWMGDTADFSVPTAPASVTIKPRVTLTTPNSGTFKVDEEVPITFSHTGDSGVGGDQWEILYSTNGGDAGGGSYPTPSNLIHTTAAGVNSPYTYNWTVPDAGGIVGNNVRVKVQLKTDPSNVKAESTSALTVRGKLLLTAPSAGAVWKVGDTTRTITWTSKQITNIRIDYTLNNGIDNYGNTIVASTGAAGGSYTWNPSGPPPGIPASAVSDQVKIRVKAIDAADSASEDFSGLMAIVPRLTLTYPTGGEVLVVGTISSTVARTITWTYSGSIDFVEIFYTKDTTGDTDGDGMPDPPENTWVPIATGANAVLPGALEYTWASVADDITTTARIILRKKNDSRTKEVKGSYFKVRGDVRLDQPDLSVPGGGLSVGSDYVIQWTPTGTLPANVKIEYSTNGFADENETSTCMGPAGQNGGSVAPGASGVQQSFTWRVPGPADPGVKVRVTQLTDSTVTDKSTNPFEIRGSLFVEVPNGNATAWIPGQTPAIQWHQLGGVANINIYYYKDANLDGNPDADDPQLYTVATNVAAGEENTTTSLAWPNPDASGNAGVPNKPTAEAYRIRIVDAANANVKDDSDACFIIKSQILLNEPNDAAIRYVGDPLTVRWTPTGQPGPVTIQYSRNAFADETQVTDLTNGYTNAQNEYAIPGGVPDALSFTGQAETVKFRVKSEQSNALLVASDVSDASFPVRGKITIGSPSASYTLGDTWNVPWTRVGSIGNVKVEYFNGSGWSTITTTAAQAGPYPLLLDSPNTTIATDGAQVRVSDADRPEVISTSTAFIVKPYFNLTSPAANGTVVYDGVTPFSITWDRKGSNVADVKIEYSRNNFSNSTVLFSGSTPNDGSEDWTVPNDLSTADNDDTGGNTAPYDVQLKISSLPLTDPFANSAVMTGAFKIVGVLGFTAPVSTTKWDAGTTQNIKWTRAGTIEKVRLMYSTASAGNGDDNMIIADYDGSLGGVGYPWPIPTTAVTDTGKVRVYDERDLSVTQLSDTFKVLPAFTVTSPVSNQRITVMQNHTITWDRVGTGVPNTVKIFYSTNGGGAWNQIMTENDGTPNDGIIDNDGTFDWAVPDLSGSPSLLPNANTMVRVEWTGDSAAKDESPLFKLVASYTVVSPNSSADKWDVGAIDQPITWTCTSANVPFVKIEYSTDGGANFNNTIAAQADNSGASGALRTYLWPNVDDNITSQFRIRISQPAVSGQQSADNENLGQPGGAGDVSDANSKIRMYVKVNSPNASGLAIKKYDAVDNPVTYPITWTTTGTGPTTTNVKLFYSKDNFATAGIPIMDGALDYTLNDNAFNWEVPDDITMTETVKVRVQSWTDLDARDESDNNFKIRGDYLITSPVNGQGFKIYDAVQNANPEAITWKTLGGAGNTMTTVNLIAYTTTPNDLYFRDGSNNVYTVPDPLGAPSGQPYNPLVIASGVPNNPNAVTTYNWQVPDKASPTVVVRIVHPNDSAVYTDSPVFKVQGSFTLTNPNPNTANQTFVVGDPLTLTWNKTGSSITRVKVSISKNGGAAWTPIIENEEGTANDGIITNDGSFDWLIPDILPNSSACILKLEDPNDASVNFITPAPNAFRVRGGLTFTSPTGAGLRWVVNENRTIEWNTSGSITAVNLYYSKNNFADWLSGPVPDPLPNSVIPVVLNYVNAQGVNSRIWDIPNDLSTTVKLRLADASDTAVFSDSTQFEIGRYNISVEVRDLLSNNHLGGLTVTATHSGNSAYNWSGTFSSPFTVPVEATKSGQTWSITFVKQGYADGAASFTANETLGDQALPVVFMETNVVHVWESILDMAYNADTDRVTLSATLQRDGIKVQGATSIDIKIYDGTTLFKSFAQAAPPDVVGFYNFTWDPPTNLVPGKVYNIMTTITNATGGNIATPRTFHVTEAAKLEEVKDTINAKLDTNLSAVRDQILGVGGADMKTQLADQKNIIVSEMALGKAAIETAATNMETMIEEKMDEFTGQVASSIISLEDAAQRSQTATENLEDAADKSQAAAKELEIVGKKYAGQLLLPPGALLGEKVILKYRGGSGLAPFITVRTDKGGKDTVIIENQRMEESTEKPGLYEYPVTITTDKFEPGKTAGVTVQAEVARDANNLPVYNLVGGSFSVVGVTLDTLQGLIASQGGVKSVAQETLQAVQAIKGNLATGGDIGRTLVLLNERLGRLPQEIAKASGSSEVKKAVAEAVQTIRTLAGNEGYNFKDLAKMGAEEALSKSGTVKDIKRAALQAAGSAEVMQILMERKLGGIDDPVVHVLYE